jgi:FixJ family two-component response regulator
MSADTHPVISIVDDDPSLTIFITAHGDARMRERVKQSGVAGFLSKPFGDRALLDLIRRETSPA